MDSLETYIDLDEDNWFEYSCHYPGLKDIEHPDIGHKQICNRSAQTPVGDYTYWEYASALERVGIVIYINNEVGKENFGKDYRGEYKNIVSIDYY